MVLVMGSLLHWHWKATVLNEKLKKTLKTIKNHFEQQAGIISHLSVTRPSLPFRSHIELLQSSYQVASIDYLRTAFLWEVFVSGYSENRLCVYESFFQAPSNALPEPLNAILMNTKQCMKCQCLSICPDEVKTY